MQQIFLNIYDYFSRRRTLLWLILSVTVAALCGLSATIDYKEDISDFMPFDAEYRKAMQVYQEVAAGNRVVLMFGRKEGAEPDAPLCADPAYVVAGIERFGDELALRDTMQWITDWEPVIDYSQILDVFSFIYEHLPLFLTPPDYARLDSLLDADPLYVRHRLQAGYDQLGSITGSFMQPMLQNDPLNLGLRMATVLRQYQPELELMHYDGYIFTPDSLRCLVTISSPFGSSETDGNARLLQLIEQTQASVQALPECRQLEVCAIGSPVIAVGNARQIKHDSILAIVISAVLILAVLLFAFRRVGALLQIVLATGFGFLFALGFISLFRDSMSVIVLGIASIIIGIAVNYPLHFLCHIQQEPNPRLTLRDLVTPLLIGNVTTVGAFLTLVPLNATAVCDLGIFSALMLVGTIIFVLIVMPQIQHPLLAAHPRAASLDHEVQLSGRISARIIRSPFSLLVIAVVTAVMGWFCLDTKFDSDLNNINYMTPRQRADLRLMSSLYSQQQGSTVYVSATASTSDEALQALEAFQRRVGHDSLDAQILSGRNPVDLLPSLDTQRRRIALWHEFWQRHGYDAGLTPQFLAQAAEVGFTPSAFAPFEALLTDSIALLTWDDFEPIHSTILTGMARPGQLVAQYQVAPADVQRVESQLRQALPQGSSAEFHIFDLASLNSRVSNALSDNFNYIGLACSLIVFAFLWFSFRRIELALLAFLPMAIGWVWILGLMSLFDIQFNLVNVILASFIFGQGDDYTIFVTEGLIREYREGRRVLVHYQRSILLSAVIMLIGIGSLILSQHPAMHSLAQVTIIGMTVVVVMAWFIPPIVFNWLVKYDRSLRRYLGPTPNTPD